MKEQLITIIKKIREILEPRISLTFHQCGRGDLNSHRIKLPLEPESSASAIPPLPLDTNYLIIEPAFCKVQKLNSIYCSNNSDLSENFNKVFIDSVMDLYYSFSLIF